MSIFKSVLLGGMLLLLPIGIIIRLITTLISPFFLGSKSDILVPCIRQNTVVLISHLPFGGNIVTRTDSFQGGCVYGKKGGGKNGLLRLYWARMIQVPMIY